MSMPPAARSSQLPPETFPRSEPPPNEVLRETLVRDFQEKLDALKELHAQLGKADHYALLGVHRAASPKEVRRAYAAASRRFHLDAFFRQHVGEHREQLEAVFKALTAAYETLRRPRTRADYDQYIGLAPADRWTAVHTETLRPSSPPTMSVPPQLDVIAAPPSFGASSDPAPSMSPPAPRVSVGPQAPSPSMRPSPAVARSLRPPPPAATRPAAPSDATSLSPARRERAAAAVRAEREAFSPDETAPVRVRPSSPSGPSGTRPSFAPEYTARIRASLPPAQTLSLLEMAQHLKANGGGLSVWAAQRLREAHQEEQAGRPGEAANILRKLLAQVRDPSIEAHVQRLQKLAGT